MISMRHLYKRFGSFEVLSDCSLEVNKGEVVVVCGPSGSGKSTLIKTINALEPFGQGELFVDGVALHDPATDLPALRSRVGMVFQHFELFPHLSVMDNLTLAQHKVLGRNASDAIARGAKLLDRVGLAEHRDKFPAQLSGGQQQRVSIARALMNGGDVILADEPTGHLDPETSEEITMLLRQISQSGTAVLLATHDYHIIRTFPSRIIKCENGSVLENASI